MNNDETKRPFRALATNDVEELILMHLEVAEQCARELAARARERFMPTPTRFKRQSEGELAVLLDLGEAAMLLGVDRRTVHRYCDTGRLSYVVFGKRRLIERAALDAFIERGTHIGQ